MTARQQSSLGRDPTPNVETASDMSAVWWRRGYVDVDVELYNESSEETHGPFSVVIALVLRHTIINDRLVFAVDVHCLKRVEHGLAEQANDGAFMNNSE